MKNHKSFTRWLTSVTLLLGLLTIASCNSIESRVDCPEGGILLDNVHITRNPDGTFHAIDLWNRDYTGNTGNSRGSISYTQISRTYLRDYGSLPIPQGEWINLEGTQPVIMSNYESYRQHTTGDALDRSETSLPNYAALWIGRDNNIETKDLQVCFSSEGIPNTVEATVELITPTSRGPEGK